VIERKYSKAKGNGNRVVWTSREVIPVPFTLDGLVYDEAEFGMFRVSGRDMYCSGFRVDFRVPAGDSKIQCSVALYTSLNTLVTGSELSLNGVSLGGDKVFGIPLPMPVNSMWKFRVSISSPDNDTTYFPQGLIAAYQLRYAAGPVNTKVFSTFQSDQGVGVSEVSSSFIVG
jgi:hypothetical protein